MLIRTSVRNFDAPAAEHANKMMAMEYILNLPFDTLIRVYPILLDTGVQVCTYRFDRPSYPGEMGY